MDGIRLNLFLGLLSIEFWVVAYAIFFWPELCGLWRMMVGVRRPPPPRPPVPSASRLVDLQMRIGDSQQR